MNEEPLNEPAPRKLPKQHVPTAEDVLQRLEAGTADLLYLAAVCHEYPSTAAQALQLLDQKWKRGEIDLWSIRGDPADGPPYQLDP